jgi:glucose uptake protein
MYAPEIYTTTLALIIYSMLCWGSWVNVHRLCKNWRFELFYWDYICGILLCSLLVGVTLGRTDPASADSFFQNLGSASGRAILFALASGAIWNLANLLIFAAMYVAGLAVAFPVGIGLAIVIGSVLNYILRPVGNPWMLFGGIAMVCVAVVLDGVAYGKRSPGTKVPLKGVMLAGVGGVLMGLFYPLIVKATAGAGHLGPYSVGFVFAVGAVVSNFPINYAFMRRPVLGEPLTMKDYFAGSARAHFWGLVAGLVFQSGTIANYVASYAKMVGPAASYAIGQGSSIVGTSWGVFVWKEFKSASPLAIRLLVLMFVFFIVGLVSIALAPVVHW